LSIAIAQTQTEQTNSPTMTVLTTQWAFQNSVNSDRSEEVSGSTDCATSAGFMGVLSAQSGSVGRTGAAQYPKSTSARDDAPLRAKPRPNVSRKSFVP
jgi:hypothetical protein